MKKHARSRKTARVKLSIKLSRGKGIAGASFVRRVNAILTAQPRAFSFAARIVLRSLDREMTWIHDDTSLTRVITAHRCVTRGENAVLISR